MWDTTVHSALCKHNSMAGVRCTQTGLLAMRRQPHTIQRSLQVPLVAAEVDEAQDAGGPRRHLRRRQRRHAGVVQHLACVASVT